MRPVRIVFPPVRLRERCARFGFLFLLIAPASFASDTVHIAGIVRDAGSGVPIANALVTLPALQRSVLTGEDGRYVIDAAPGAQRVTVSRMGYAAAEFEAFVPASGDLEIHVEMRREPIRFPPIHVRASLPLRGLAPVADRADRSVTRDELNHDPLLVEPDFLRALAGGDVVVAPENPSGLHVRGGASDQVGYVVDGIPVFNPYHSAGTFSAWNPDALSQVDLLASAATPAAPDALSGTVSAHTRTPGTRHHTRGSISATQVRATVDGPVARTQTGYLFSVTSAFPGLAFHKSEASHLDGDNLDLLAKTESPLFGGRLRVLGYGSRNHVDAAATGEAGDTTGAERVRNTFGWTSRSLGVEWSLPMGSTSLTLRSWSARGDVDAAWSGAATPSRVESSRRELGAVAMLGAPMAGGQTTFGARVQDMRSAYHHRAAGDAYSLDVSTPVSTVFVEHARDLAAAVMLGMSLSGAFAAGEAYLSPTAQLRWQPVRSLAITGTAAKRHQFGQSLRNAESVISTIFPAEMYVGAGERGVPVAASTIGILALDHRPSESVRFGAQAYVRDFAGLALVAPGSADPFATTGFVEGSGRAYGVALEGAATRARFGFLASYGYQDVRLEYAGGDYVPGYGAVHSFEAGVTFVSAPGYSVRLGYEGMMGRRTTSALGDLEYEAVNLLDQGGEFGGSPAGWSGALGGTSLPAYQRLDLGVRKSWHTRFANRDGVLSAFGTVSNLMSRANVLTFAVDPATGEATPIEMRPFSPLVVGIDWQF